MNNYLQYFKDHHKCYVVFDFDGTLVDLDIDWSGWESGLQLIYKKFENTYDTLTFTDRYSIYNEMIEKYDDPIWQEIIDFATGYEKTHFKGYTENLNAIDAIVNGIGISCHVLSANTHILLDPIFSQLGIKDQIQTVIGREDLQYEKPNPEGLLEIMGMNSNLNEWLMIGDQESDEQTAQNAGIDFAYVASFGAWK